MGQYKYFLKIQEDKVKDKRKERELLLENFKELDLKNKRLEDGLKDKGGRSSESSLWKTVGKSFRRPKKRQKNSES